MLPNYYACDRPAHNIIIASFVRVSPVSIPPITACIDVVLVIQADVVLNNLNKDQMAYE
jgi:hypothetical protein